MVDIQNASLQFVQRRHTNTKEDMIKSKIPIQIGI